MMKIPAALRARIVAVAAVAALCMASALTGCSVLRGDAGADADPPGSSSPAAPGAASSQIPFLVSNQTQYTLIQGALSGKVDPSSSSVAPSSQITVNLTSDSSASDTGTIQYTVYDTDGTNALGVIAITFTKDLSHGVSTGVDVLGIGDSTLNVFGNDTDGSTAVFFVDGVCGGPYSGGIASIDQTIVNATPYPMTLMTDVQHTNAQGGGWSAYPQSTIAPGACAQINSYTDDPIAGYAMTATFAFDTPTGTQYAVFSNSAAPETPDGGGLTRQSEVFSTVPQLNGLGWTGTRSGSFTAYDSDITPFSSDHYHLATVIGSAQ